MIALGYAFPKLDICLRWRAEREEVRAKVKLGKRQYEDLIIAAGHIAGSLREQLDKPLKANHRRGATAR
jgi:hypothetical protein